MKRNNSFKVFVFVFIIFFSLSGSTARDNTEIDGLIVVDEITEQVQAEEEPPIVYSVEIIEPIPPPPPPPPPHTESAESTELDSLLYEQRIMLDKNIRKADDMGNELDKMIEMLGGE